MSEKTNQAFIEECQARFKADEEDRLQDGYGDYGDCGEDFIDAVARLKELEQQNARLRERWEKLKKHLDGAEKMVRAEGTEEGANCMLATLLFMAELEAS